MSRVAFKTMLFEIKLFEEVTAIPAMFKAGFAFMMVNPTNTQLEAAMRTTAVGKFVFSLSI